MHNPTKLGNSPNGIIARPNTKPERLVGARRRLQPLFLLVGNPALQIVPTWRGVLQPTLSYLQLANMDWGP